MLKTGTAKVKITSITNFDKKNITAKPLTNHKKKTVTKDQLNQPLTKNYIQVFATSKLMLAKETATLLSKKYSQTVNYPEKNAIYRIQIGPILDDKVRDKLLLELKQGSYPNAYLRSL
jgi:rare lipoprotein A